MRPAKLIKRYVARRDSDGSWHAYDRLHRHPYMSAENRADAIRCAKYCNEKEPLIASTCLRPVKLTTREWRHYRKVVRQAIKKCNDKYELANQLASLIEYKSDRMHDEAVVRIQLMWEELQRQNGYEPMSPK